MPTGRGQTADAQPWSNTAREFGIECTLCGTRFYATPDKIGKQVKCPDCHSMVLVKPPDKAPQPVRVTEDDDDAEFKLSDPVTLPHRVHLQEEDVRAQRAAAKPRGNSGECASKSPAPSQRLPTDIVRDHASQVLAKAEAEIDEQERVAPKRPDQPFTTGVVSFLFDAPAALRWLLLTFLFHGAAYSGILASELAQAGPVQQFAAVFLSVATLALALLLAGTASACALAIVQDTANGLDKVEQWPGINVLEWGVDGLCAAVCLFASIAVGLLPGLMLAPPAGALVMGAMSGTALFPILLLSSLEEGSLIGFASQTIWRSLKTSREVWGRFYLVSAFLVLGGIVAALLMVATGFFIGAFFAAIAVALAMVYSRLLGRLAGCLSEASAQQEMQDVH